MPTSTIGPMVPPAAMLPDKFDSSKRIWRNNVYEALDEAGLSKTADRWLTCSDQIKTRIRPVEGAKLPDSAKMIYVCTGDHRHEAEIYSQSCDLRICPDCAAMHSARFCARFSPKCLELLHQHHRTFRFRHIVFTTPYAMTDADARKRMLRGFKQVERAMNALMSRRAPWQANQGYIVAAEFGEQGRKLHYHVIHYGMYLNQVDIVNAWRESTAGECEIIFVRGLHREGTSIDGEIREVLKYATKFYSKDKNTGEISYLSPHLMPVLANILEKTRRIRAYGVFYNLPEPDRSTHTCNSCESPMLGIPVEYFVTYCNTGMLPFEFARAKRDALLLLRTADKSVQHLTNLSPPGDAPGGLHQKDLSIFKNIRSQKYD